ncbi:MAG: restriction endonuclease subunit S [Pirellulaceae bacterium]
MKTPLVSIAEIAEINPRVPQKLAKQTGCEVNFVPMSHLSENGYAESNGTRRLGEVLKGYTYFENGDVLVAKITPCMENGKAALVGGLPHPVSFGSTEFHVLRPGPTTDGRYLFYMVWNSHFRHAAERNMTGTAGQKRVPKSFLERYQVPLLPLPEQKRIADILDKADAIRRKRQKTLSELLLVPGSAFHEMFGSPSHNTKGWEIGTIRDLVTEVKYGTSSKAGAEGNYPILRMNNITYEGTWDLSDLKYIDIPADDEPKYLVRKGDLLFNRTNSKELVGKTAVFQENTPMAFAGYLVRARAAMNAHPDYIAGYLNSPHGKATLRHMCKSIIGMANINAQEFQDIRIPKPPIEAQLEYVQILDAVRASERPLRAALTEADALFNSLVKQAFKGEL